MTTDSHECNGAVQGHEVEFGGVEVGEIRKTTLVEEKLKPSEDKMTCNGDSSEICDAEVEVDNDDNLAEGDQCELKLENGEGKFSDHVSEHGAEENESQRSEREEKGNDLEFLESEKKNVDIDVVENGASEIDAQAFVDNDLKVEVHDSADEHKMDPELQCLTNEKSGVETESAKNEEQETVQQVVGDIEGEVEPKSVNNEDRLSNLEEIVGDNNTGLSDLVDEDERKEYVEEDGGNQSENTESENAFSEEHKLESSEALHVLDRNCKLENMITQTLIDEESQHDSEMMNEKCKSLKNKDNASDCVINEVDDWKPQFVLNKDKGPELSVEDKSIELESYSVVVEEDKSELQCMPNGSIELAYHLDVTDDRGVESHIETHDDKGLESKMETHDDKVEEVSNGKDEASELEIGSINESIIDGASDKSGETSGLNNCIEQSGLLEKIADGAEWVSTGDPVPSNKSLPQISSNEPKLELDVPKKTFYCLVKIPRHVDNKIKAQIRIAELQMNEKSKTRDFINAALTMKRTSKDQILDSLKAARLEEKTIYEAIRVKKYEMEPLQSTLNKMKNANSAEEYDEKIYQMEYRIAHESMPLSEEKKLIREIKQLKTSRDELCASAGPHSELQEAFNHIDKIQDHNKLLGQELETLKRQAIQAQKNRQVFEKEFTEVNEALRQLRTQRDAANTVRQEAYDAFRDLKRQEYERNNEFYKNKGDIQTAKQYAHAGDREALEKLCSNQVERIIEMWNKNAEFRKEYIKDNETSTLRRLETFDGRSLGPDEEPPLPTNYDEHLDISPLSQGKPSSDMRPVRENKSTTDVESKPKGLQSASKEVTVLTKNSAGQQSLSKEVADPPKQSDGKSKKSGLVTKIEPFQVNSEIVKSEEEDLAKKEEAAKKKEARRLEEIKKAKEAEERKRRLAERANAKALARAQKEAERKEKERQKRANKKAAAAAAASVAIASDTAENDDTSSGMQNDASKDSKLSSISEARELRSTSQKSSPSQRKKPVSQKVKPVFPAVKKGKKVGQTWMWILLAVVLCLFLLVLWFRF